jgi:pectate lyase
MFAYRRWIYLIAQPFIFLAFLFFLPTSAYALPAFPGAEGFGANTPGGRGGQVIEVINLDDSGFGSLRACVEASGPRTCVFRTGGTIELNSTLTITNPYISIAGQTAPGGGITIKHSGGGIGILIETHDVIVRYLTVRPGPGSKNQAIAMWKNGSPNVHDIVIDHCSTSWATDEVVTTWYAANNITIQWSIIAEGLKCSTHPDGCHSKGSLMGGYKNSEAGDGIGAYDISFHHNLLAHHTERGPMIKTGGLVDVVNNVTYNMGGINSHIFVRSPGLSGNIIPVNYVGNYFKFGPSTGSGKYEIGSYYESGPATAHIYLEGNIGPHRPSDSYPQDALLKPSSVAYQLVSSRFTAPAITETNASTAYNQIIADVGANKSLDRQGNYYWRQDVVDQRIINDVQNTTGQIINHPSEVGGWPNLPTIYCDQQPDQCYPDIDHDGTSDDWEQAWFSNLYRGSANDSSGDYDSDGYTDLEEFLNGTNPKNDSPAPTSTPSPTPIISPPSSGGIYEAEDDTNTLVSAEYSNEHCSPPPAFCSGTGFINFTADSGASITWNYVNVTSSGTYPIVFRYALGDLSRSVEIRVNGNVVEPNLIFSNTGDWKIWQTKTINVSLNSGDNTIQVTTTGQDGPNIDYLQVQTSPPTFKQLLSTWLTSTFDQNGDNKVNSLDIINTIL